MLFQGWENGPNYMTPTIKKVLKMIIIYNMFNVIPIERGRALRIKMGLGGGRGMVDLRPASSSRVGLGQNGQGKFENERRHHEKENMQIVIRIDQSEELCNMSQYSTINTMGFEVSLFVGVGFAGSDRPKS